MTKLLVLLCIALIAMTVVMACTPPGAPCSNSNECCAGFVCNPWAGRCTGGPGTGGWGPRGPPQA